MTKANYHTHTTWCDGKDTPEAVVAAAIDKGFSAIGFSSHAMLPEDDTPWLLTPEKAPRYAAEIRPPRRRARKGMGNRRLEPHRRLGMRPKDGKEARKDLCLYPPSACKMGIGVIKVFSV